MNESGYSSIAYNREKDGAYIQAILNIGIIE
jgi:hypothetical protein